MSVVLKLKNPTDESTVLKNLPGGQMDNPIIKFASQIEKVKTRTEIEELIKQHRDANELDLFKLGGAIVVAQELFNKPNSEFADYKNFGEYVEIVHSIPYDKAMHAARIYRKLV